MGSCTGNINFLSAFLFFDGDWRWVALGGNSSSRGMGRAPSDPPNFVKNGWVRAARPAASRPARVPCCTAGRGGGARIPSGLPATRHRLEFPLGDFKNVFPPL